VRFSSTPRFYAVARNSQTQIAATPEIIVTWGLRLLSQLGSNAKKFWQRTKIMAEHSSGKWWKWLLVLTVLAAAGGGYWYVRHNRAQPLAYKTEAVARGELTKLVTATGTLNPVVNVTVGSQVSGRICKLNVDWNSVVISNEVIAEIDPATYQAALEQAKADLANAEANQELQQVECRRSSDLFTNKLISGSDYDTAVANLHEAEATVKIKQASLYNAQVNLNYCKSFRRWTAW